MIDNHRLIGICAVLCSTFAEAVGQLAFKQAANRAHGRSDGATASEIRDSFENSLLTTARNIRWILLGWLGFAIQACLWSVALYHLDVTVAHPIGSIVFVAVAIVSQLILGERISRLRWAGIGLILAGSVLVALN